MLEGLAHPALPFRLLLAVRLAVLGAGSLHPGHHVVQDVQAPIDILWKMLHETVAYACGSGISSIEAGQIKQKMLLFPHSFLQSSG